MIVGLFFNYPGNVIVESAQGFDMDEEDFLIVIDKFGRKWKLEPIKNENIMIPFIITPLENK